MVPVVESSSINGGNIYSFINISTLYSALLHWIDFMDTSYLYDIRHLYGMHVNVGFTFGVSYLWIDESGLFLALSYFSSVTPEPVLRSGLWSHPTKQKTIEYISGDTEINKRRCNCDCRCGRRKYLPSWYW